MGERPGSAWDWFLGGMLAGAGWSAVRNPQGCGCCLLVVVAVLAVLVALVVYLVIENLVLVALVVLGAWLLWRHGSTWREAAADWIDRKRRR